MVEREVKWTLEHTAAPDQWKYIPSASMVVCTSAKGGDRPLFDIRGWGYLTGQGSGAIGLTPGQAGAEQDKLAEFILASCRSALLPTTRDSLLDEMAKAAEAARDWIVDLGDSGDAGFWDGRQAPEVVAIDAALTRYRATTDGRAAPSDEVA